MTMWTSLDPAAVAVDPGGRATARLRVRNTGDTVEEYRLSVVGAPAGWARVEPDTLRLYPGSEGVAEISFAPPRSPDALAGPASYGIRVEPREHPGARDVLEGQVTVAPFSEVRAELLPSVLVGRFGARASVAVDNIGNTALTASLTLRDEANRLTCEMAPNSVQVAPGRAAFVKLNIRPQRIRWTGGTEHHRVTVAVRRSGDDTTVDLNGTYEQRAVVPRWMLVVGSAAVAASVAFVMLWLGFQPKVTTATGEMQSGSGAQAVPQGAEAPLPPAPSSAPPAVPPGAPAPAGDGSGGGAGGGDASQVGGGPPVPPPAPKTAPKAAADAPVGPVWDMGYKPDAIVTYAQYRLATLGNECALKAGWTAAVIDQATQTSLACYQRHVMADQKSSRQLTLTDKKYGTLGRATLTSMWAQGIRPEDVTSGANNFKVRMLAASLWWANQSSISDVDLDRDRGYANQGIAYFKDPGKGEPMKADGGLTSAVKEYQRNVGLKVTGVADSKTLNWLVGGAVKEPGKVGR
ncbi:peptidoglycan-binding domain-containing protein [Streptomyces sp. NBC_00083]|uniref:peptidoglycan-binding domain-containing protein n=1 Tax=Streptomyces sp. NBC_00083 TaxID=2975647 RepID=UPI002254F435|nr:peptidoglycan-binding domain-containing protein [Streptomyces sp. NBC_00083]MCX5388271.1 peptidoglycan-binding protein [Streptomyces sp. NBC_00083]